MVERSRDRAGFASGIWRRFERGSLKRGDDDLIVRDARHTTSYRFRLWYDANWQHPNKRITGGWFLQNVALANLP